MPKEAQTLSDKQIQQTVGNIEKKRKVKILRNSLAFPYLQSWPAVNSTDAKDLIVLLEELLPKAKLNYSKPVWKDICNLSKCERKQLKERQMKISNQNIYRQLIFPGYSAVTRGLEREEICCCILADEVKPPVLIKNIVSLAQNKNVPVVIISSLKSVLQKSLGFSAMVIGFKVTVEKEPNCIFSPIFKCILELYKKFPLGEEINAQTRPVNIDNGITSETSSPKKNVERTKSDLNFHLFLTSQKGPRIFVPPREHQNDILSTSSLAFIPIDKDEPESNVKTGNRKKINVNMAIDEESEDDIECEEIFQIDTKPNNLLKTSWEEENVQPVKKKRKNVRHLLNMSYQPTKIKVTKSNPMKSFKRKKRKRETST